MNYSDCYGLDQIQTIMKGARHSSFNASDIFQNKWHCLNFVHNRFVFLSSSLLAFYITKCQQMYRSAIHMEYTSKLLYAVHSSYHVISLPPARQLSL